MSGEVDPRLIGLLQAVMGLGDALRDAGAQDKISVRLSREDGLSLLEVVAGASHPEAEAFSQHGRPRKPGLNSIKVANLTLEWPQDGATPDMMDLFSGKPEAIGHAGNENSRARPMLARCYGFEEDQPALR